MILICMEFMQVIMKFALIDSAYAFVFPFRK
jgi:hypothetical protein